MGGRRLFPSWGVRRRDLSARGNSAARATQGTGGVFCFGSEPPPAETKAQAFAVLVIFYRFLYGFDKKQNWDGRVALLAPTG